MSTTKEKFKVETVKWTWAEPVKSKNVYRDDELVRTKTKEDALEAIAYLLKESKGGHHYTITVFRDGEYLTYWRHSMPCYGGLVKYKDSHGDKYYMNPYFPRDIRVAYPEGDTVFIACRQTHSLDNPYHQFLLSQESPWVSAFGSKDTVLIEKTHFVLTNMNTDPTVFYSLLRLGKFCHAISGNAPYQKWDPKAQILALLYSQADPRRLAGQKPIRISGGTWAEGYGYTRPYNESIFKTAIPTALKDFAKLGSYMYAPQTTDYFFSSLKKEFGFSGSTFAANKDNEQMLVKAWDFFKQESKKLGDVPGEKYK